MAQIPQPQGHVVRGGGVVKQRGPISVGIVDFHPLTSCHQDLRLHAAGHHRPLYPRHHRRGRGGQRHKAGDGDGAAQGRENWTREGNVHLKRPNFL